MKKITVKEVEALGSDSLRVFGGTFEGGINIQQVPDEIAPCINAIIGSGKEIKNFLEIGSAAGGTSFLFDHVFDLDNLVVIDDNRHPKHGLRQENLKNVAAKVKEFIGNSQEPGIIAGIGDLGYKFDAIMVDGDHSYIGLMADIGNYAPFLADDGFLILHDIEIAPSVKRVLQDLECDGGWVVEKFLSETHKPCGLGLLRRS